MSEELDVLADVVHRLEAAHLPYMVTGSFAASYYSEPRMTRDIDIVVEIDAAAISKVHGLFSKAYYIDDGAVREAVARQSTFNVIHNALIVKVDFIVRKQDPYREEEFRRRQPVTIDGLRVYMVAPEDLVLSKLFWAKDNHSERQLADVRGVLKQVEGLDYSYMEAWARELGISDLFEEARSR